MVTKNGAGGGQGDYSVPYSHHRGKRGGVGGSVVVAAAMGIMNL